MADDMSGVDHNSPAAGLWPDCEEFDKQNLEEFFFSWLQNDGSSDKQNIVGTSTSDFDPDWDYVRDRQYTNNNNYGGFGVYSSSEGLSVGSEATSRISTQGPDARIILRSKGPIRDESVRKSALRPQNESVENSIKNLSIFDLLSLSSENDEADVMPSEGDRDDMQSESTINLKDGTDEFNFQVPELGMVFPSEDEAYSFYKNYATSIGFSVRKGKIQRLANGTIRKRYFFCSKQGFRSKKQSDKMTKYKRKETRTGCEAMVQFTINNGEWKITRVVLDHNHDSEGSDQRHLISPSTNTSKEDARNSSINKSGMVKEPGDANSEGFRFVDSSIYLRTEKINILPPEDGQSLIDFFKLLQLEDPSFFYTVQVDAESRLINFFWRDGRSKIDYEYFGDVVILDTTFRIDRYDIICAPFLGINHHRQYVLFGCAFLLDDSMDSFVWLFRTFVEAMGMRLPKTIFTEEHPAISDAIEEVLPEIQHRVSMWYIIQNARKNLSEFYEEPGFEDLFNKYIFCGNSEEEFLSMWDLLLKTYNLHDNLWLLSLHMMREKWSRVFKKITFSAGIESFQGCENIINVFHTSAAETITLSKSVEQYLGAAERLRSEELKEDIHCSESEPAMILRGSELEKQAANVYTCAIFKLFQDELCGCLSLAIEVIRNDGSIVIFKLTEEGHRESIVEFNCLGPRVTCNCKKYESVGILCVHSLKVLNARNIFYIPSQYILKRWTKSVKDEMVLVDHKQGTTHESQRPLNLLMARLMQKALHVATKSVGVEGSWKIVEHHLDLALREIVYVLRTKKTGYLNGKDAELRYIDDDANGTEFMEMQTKVLTPPSFSQKELHKHCVKVRLKRKQENEVRGTERKSYDDAITHHQPLREERQVGNDQGSRARFSSPHCVGENFGQQPLQLAFCVVKDPGMFSGFTQECMSRQKKISKLTEEIGESSSH